MGYMLEQALYSKKETIINPRKRRYFEVFSRFCVVKTLVVLLLFALQYRARIPTRKCGGVEGAEGDPPREIVERKKAAANARPTDRRGIVAEIAAAAAAAAAAGARNKIFPGRKKAEEKINICCHEGRTLMFRRLR